MSQKRTRRGSASQQPKRTAPAAGALRSPRYVGSPEHKTTKACDTLPRFRSDATPCPPDMKERAEAQALLDQAIQNRLYEGEMPAKYVYAASTDRRMVFEGRLTNQESLWYKGYPVSWDEIPDQVRERILARQILTIDDVSKLKSSQDIINEVLK